MPILWPVHSDFILKGAKYDIQHQGMRTDKKRVTPTIHAFITNSMANPLDGAGCRDPEADTELGANGHVIGVNQRWRDRGATNPMPRLIGADGPRPPAFRRAPAFYFPSSKGRS